MSSHVLYIVGPLALLLLLMACRVPVAFALAIGGSAGLVLLGSVDTATSTLASVPYGTTATYTLTLIPMFILMGLFVSHAGLLEHLFDLAQKLTRRLPGGLGVSTVLACTFFGGISGSSVADAATLGRLSIGGMSKRGYDQAYAAAIVAASGTVAILIPPSIALVIYGIVSGESIASLLLAGIVPGILTGITYATLIILRARYSPSPGYGGKDSLQTAKILTVSPSESRWLVTLAAASGVVLFSVVVGGLYAGIFTATEAGAVGAVTAFGLSLAFMLARRRAVSNSPIIRPVIDAVREAGSLTSMIFALIIGATIFTQFLTVAGVPADISEWILGLGVPPQVVVALFLLMLLPLGALIDGMSMLLIVTPIAYPVISELGFDGVWFGILMIKMVEVGLLTPPVGLNVYVVSGLFDGLRSENIFKKIWPFVTVELLLTAVLFVFPEIVTFLPDMASTKEALP